MSFGDGRIHGRIRAIRIEVTIDEDDGTVSVWEAEGTTRKGDTSLTIAPDYTPEPRGSWRDGTARRGRGDDQPALTDGVSWTAGAPQRVNVHIDAVLRPIPGVPLFVTREGQRDEAPQPPKQVVLRLTDLGKSDRYEQTGE
jgi:hypothetical protein